MNVLLQLLDRIAGRDLTLAQIGPRKDRKLRQRVQIRRQVDDLADPLAIGLGGSQPVLDGGIVVELALGGIDGNHLPGTQRDEVPQHQQRRVARSYQQYPPAPQRAQTLPGHV